MKSEKKSNDFRIAMKLAFKDNWIFMIAFGIISAIFAGFVAMQLGESWQEISAVAQEAEKVVGGLHKYFETFAMGYGSFNMQVLRIYSDLILSMIVIVTFIAFFVVLKNFSFLYSKSKADFYLTLPIKRNSMVASKIICCFLCVFIAFAVQLVGFIFVMVSFNHFTAVGQGLLLLLGSFAQCTAIMAVFVFCAVSSGRIFNYAVLSISMLVLPIVSKIPLLIRNFYIPNYSIPREQYQGETKRWLYFFIAAILVALTVVLFRKRRSEFAQSAVVFRLPVSISVFAVQLFGFFIAPLLFAYLKVRLNFTVLLLTCVAVTAVLTVVAELVLDKFRQKKIIIGQLVVVTVVFLAVSTCAITLNSKVAEKPENLQAENVEKVVLYIDQLHYYNNFVEGNAVFEWQTINNPENILKAVDLKEELVSDKINYNYMTACYVMKNGKNVIKQISNDMAKSIVENPRVVEGRKFLAADFGETPIMLVSKWIDQDTAKSISIRDKAEIAKISGSVEDDMQSNSMGCGQIYVIALNDDLPEAVKRDFEQMTDEQLTWIAINNFFIKGEYGKFYHVFVSNKNIVSIADERGTVTSKVPFEFTLD